MALWVHLSKYLLFAVNLPSFKLFSAGNTVFRTASVKHTDLKPSDKEIPFSVYKKEKRKNNDFRFT